MRGIGTGTARHPSGGAAAGRVLPADDRERHRVAQLVDAVPRVDPRGDVGTDDEEELAIAASAALGRYRSCT